LIFKIYILCRWRSTETFDKFKTNLEWKTRDARASNSCVYIESATNTDPLLGTADCSQELDFICEALIIFLIGYKHLKKQFNDRLD